MEHGSVDVHMRDFWGRMIDSAIRLSSMVPHDATYVELGNLLCRSGSGAGSFGSRATAVKWPPTYSKWDTNERAIDNLERL